MEFKKWWETEGSIMQEGGCTPEIIARAAWFVAKQTPVEKSPYKFLKNLMDNQVDSPPEISKLVDKHFWELI